jgi:hypothetical protein
VNPLELLGQAETPDGADLKLTRRGNEYIILANGKSLMSSRMHGSEEALATLGCRRARMLKRPSVVDRRSRLWATRCGLQWMFSRAMRMLPSPNSYPLSLNGIEDLLDRWRITRSKTNAFALK